MFYNCKTNKTKSETPQTQHWESLMGRERNSKIKNLPYLGRAA